MKVEYEIKFLNINKNTIRKILKESGGNQIIKERLMKRKVFDLPHIDLKEGEYKWLRVRDEGEKVTATLKYIDDLNKIEGTKETEVIVNDFEAMVSLFEELGLELKNYQENYREEWHLGEAHIAIDTWPGLNPYIEIEADSKKDVENVCRLLGFDFKEGVFGSADVVYEIELGVPINGLASVPSLTFSNRKDALSKFM